MSVVTDSPFCRSKRPFLWESEYVQQVKRRRYVEDNPLKRLGPSQLHEILAILRKQFPQMDEKVISDTIVLCAGDIDSAIQHLSKLKLDAIPQESHSQKQQQYSSHTVKQADQEQAVPSQDAKGCEQSLFPADDQKTGLQWADELVKAVTGAKDGHDAQQRSMVVLEGVEKAVLAQGTEQHKQRINELIKENTILKRAVAIQNNKIIEMQTEKESMQNIIDQGQKQVKQLEINNYSLALHLKHATTSGGAGHDRFPDIY